jgi:thiamine biosynthesis protein ThiI
MTRIRSASPQWQYFSRLHLVPFGEIQREVVLSVAPPGRVVVYRRLMVRIAEALARASGAQALVTGESLGQVASQTLENMSRINEAATLPILRPLIGMDKQEITASAGPYPPLKPTASLPHDEPNI